MLKRAIVVVKTSRAAVPPGVGYFVREASRSFSRALQDVFFERGVTLPQFLYLRVLWEADGVSQAYLSRRIGADRATVSFVLNTMEKQNMIVRRPDPDDLRKTKIFLTTFGRRLRAPLLRLANDINATATRGLKKQQIDQVTDVLKAIIGNLQQTE
jgi:MarR family transcriptional regulator, organic hydroperoxide resistance regulator